MASKGEKLKKFFNDLAKDPDKPGSLYKKYLDEPRKVMADEGLDQDVIDAVMSGDLAVLNDLLKSSNIICGTLVRI